MCDGGGGVGGSWFRDSVTKTVGNGKSTFFWTDPWIGGVALAVRFRRLFELSVNKYCTVEDMFGLGWGEEGGAWQWRMRLWDREEELVGECRLLLANVVLQVKTPDCWRWRHDNTRCYSVRSAYDLMTSDHIDTVDATTDMIWHKHVSLKVFILA